MYRKTDNSYTIYQIFTDKTTHKIPNIIRHLAAVLVISFPLTSIVAERMFNQLKIVKMKLRTQMSQDVSNNR